MQQARMLWMDLDGGLEKSPLYRRLREHYSLQICADQRILHQQVRDFAPDILCFDVAQLSVSERALIQRCRRKFSSTPVLLFTANGAADTLLWALRARVWDCFIKPASSGEVMRRLNILLPVLGSDSGQRDRKLLMPEPGALTRQEAKACAPVGSTDRVLPYLHRHFDQRIPLAQAAAMCQLSSFEFSRRFRREQGVTFRDYLIHRRIEAAALKLRSGSDSVLSVGCAVGFNDPSQFSRLFRRHMGLTPSQYRGSESTAVSS